MHARDCRYTRTARALYYGRALGGPQPAVKVGVVCGSGGRGKPGHFVK